MAKVVLVDNFNTETIADKVLKENVTEQEARKLADDYNRKHPGDSWFARAVDDNYKLWRGMAELV